MRLVDFGGAAREAPEGVGAKAMALMGMGSPIEFVITGLFGVHEGSALLKKLVQRQSWAVPAIARSSL